jgi:hypothetical protein
MSSKAGAISFVLIKTVKDWIFFLDQKQKSDLGGPNEKNLKPRGRMSRHCG